MPLLIALPYGPFLAWKRGDLKGASQRLYVAIGIALLVTLLAASLYDRGPMMAPVGLGIGAWLIVGALSEIAFRAKVGKANMDEVLRRLWKLTTFQPMETAVAHLGVGVCVVGIVGTSAWKVEQVAAMKPGENDESCWL